MGSYLNPGNDLFKMARQSQIFIDKSGLIDVTNKSLGTLQRYMCVSRPRRFGKSMAADMRHIMEDVRILCICFTILR